MLWVCCDSRICRCLASKYQAIIKGVFARVCQEFTHSRFKAVWLALWHCQCRVEFSVSRLQVPLVFQFLTARSTRFSGHFYAAKNDCTICLSWNYPCWYYSFFEVEPVWLKKTSGFLRLELPFSLTFVFFSYSLVLRPVFQTLIPTFFLYDSVMRLVLPIKSHLVLVRAAVL